MGTFIEDIESIHIEAALKWACDPAAMTYLSGRFSAGGEAAPSKPVTKAVVERRYGPEAAEAWAAIGEAKARFRRLADEAVRARRTTSPPPGE